MTDEPRGEFITGRIVTGGRIIDDGLLAFERDRIVYCGPADGFTGEDSNRQTKDRAYDDGQLHRGPRHHRSPRADEARPVGGFIQTAAAPDGSLILPGLVDMHCHGANGGDFPSGDEDQARAAIDFLHRSGTTSLLASMVTASYEDLERGVRTLSDLTADGLIAGIHVEGPFLSHVRCGAQNPAWLRDPDPGFTSRLLEAAAGTIRTMTYAPELPGADGLVTTLADAGVVPSLGHTDCDADTAAASLQLAAESLPGRRPTVTHLFNGMPPAHHRFPGPVPVCLRAAKAGRAVVELIADNVHLAPQTVLSVFDLAGADNVALVSDSMAAAGLDDGEYSLGPSAVAVRDGVATLETGSIAGGTATLLQILQRTVDAGVPLADAVTAATEVPAAVIGAGDHIGSLKPGFRADALIVSAGWQLEGVLRQGFWL